VAGLELPVKLRRGLGKGSVVPVEELARRLAPLDGDGDGALVRGELARFLVENRIGGPWFCEMLARTLWKTAEERTLTREVQAISVAALARVLHFTMSRGPRAERRYVLDPAAMIGLEPRRTLDGSTDLTLGGEKAAPARPAPSAAPKAAGAAPLARPAPARPGASPAARPTPTAPGGPSGPTASPRAPAPMPGRRPGPTPTKPR
jgi:hypothetical protein